jgi:hypothetical protein
LMTRFFVQRGAGLGAVCRALLRGVDMERRKGGKEEDPDDAAREW